MLQNAYLLAKIGADTAENEQHFAKNLRKTDNYPTGPPLAIGGLAHLPVSGWARKNASRRCKGPMQCVCNVFHVTLTSNVTKLSQCIKLAQIKWTRR